jgi:hypothetical protein
MFFLSGDVSNVTCAILEVPNKNLKPDKNNLNPGSKKFNSG